MKFFIVFAAALAVASAGLLDSTVGTIASGVTNAGAGVSKTAGDAINNAKGVEGSVTGTVGNVAQGPVGQLLGGLVGQISNVTGIRLDCVLKALLNAIANLINQVDIYVGGLSCKVVSTATQAVDQTVSTAGDIVDNVAAPVGSALKNAKTSPLDSAACQVQGLLAPLAQLVRTLATVLGGNQPCPKGSGLGLNLGVLNL